MTTSPSPSRVRGRIALVAGCAFGAAMIVGWAGQYGIATAHAAGGLNLFGRQDAKAVKAVTRAEAAVAKAPNSVAARSALGQAYLAAGRFASAATTFEDALVLGDESGRTALGLALAQIGSGRSREAIALLDQYRDAIPAGDLGLALALAGETSRGVAILADAVRGGGATPKVRQNLAYAYALDGRWTEAKLMAAQDIPSDQLDKRLALWALSMLPDRGADRVATLVGAPAGIADPGQPTALALNVTPQAPQMAVAEPVAAPTPSAVPEAGHGAAPVGDAELPATSFAAAAPREAPVHVAAPHAAAAQPAAVAPARPAVDAILAAHVAASQTVARPAAPVGMRAAVAAPARRAVVGRSTPAAASVKAKAGQTGHFVQLGAFSSQQNAARAKELYVRRNPALAAYQMTITPANVNGRQVWRVAAGGLSGRMAATSLCAQVRSGGGGCFAYYRPLNAAPGVSAPVLRAMAGAVKARPGQPRTAPIQQAQVQRAPAPLQKAGGQIGPQRARR